MAEIKYIKTNRLLPHPQNPRKELGDLAELSDSIKANGVMQNLTVVPHGHGYYTIIIGHRRHAAAKLAGLTSLPCVVADLDEKQQLSIMMIENMQRTDLTYYEQAQGFQLMLDMGDDIANIAKTTGFSESTVRHRLKMAELDGEKLKEAQTRPATLTDYAKLEKIKDVGLRNKVLEDIGTSRFEYSLQNAIREENKAKALEAWRMFLLDLGFEEIPADDNEYYKTKDNIKSFNATSVKPEEFTEKCADIIAENEMRYFRFSCGWVYIYKKKPVETDAAKAEKARAAELKQGRKSQLEDINEALWGRINKFIDSYKSKPDDFNTIIKLFITSRFETEYLNIPDLNSLKVFIKPDVIPRNARIKDIKDIDIAKEFLKALIKTRGNNTCYTTDLNYFVNIFMINLLDTLTKIGFVAADDEIQYINGTHIIFTTERNADNEQ